MRALWLLLLVGCGRLVITDAIPSRPWPETARTEVLTAVANEADGYVMGTVERADKDWTYDRVRGDWRTYRLTIRAADGKWRLLVFVPTSDTLPLPIGTHAVFIWRYADVFPYLTCDGRRAVTLVCPPDWLPVVPSRDHVAAPTDSALVASLFAKKRR